jgi:hypothetical protein
MAPQNLDGEDGWGRRSYDRKRKVAMQPLTRTVEAEEADMEAAAGAMDAAIGE